MVVLPEPVPPETRTFTRQRPMAMISFAAEGVIAPNSEACRASACLFEFTNSHTSAVDRERQDND